MEKADFDLFVIGGGSGGVRAGRVAAQMGKRVAIVDSHRYGGTCVIRGCVPKKLMVYASQFGAAQRDGRGFGWDLSGPFHWGRFKEAMDNEVSRLSGLYEKGLSNANATILRGHGKIIDANTVSVEGTTYKSKRILIATGGTPFMPPVDGIEHAISSNEVFLLESLPKSLLVVGGGYIALEFAHIFSNLGTQVTLIHRGETVLRTWDNDIQSAVHTHLEQSEIDERLSCEVRSIRNSPAGKEVMLSTGDILVVEEVLFATGRTPNTNNLGLDNVGVQTSKKGAIAVNEFFETNIPGIFAVGDCTDNVQLTPVAIREAQAFIHNAFHAANEAEKMAVDYSNIPSAVFCQPPAASVGLTESQANKQFPDNVSIFRSTFRPMKQTLSGRPEKTTMKLVVHQENDVLLGAHMVGPDSPEIIQMLAIAVKNKLTKKQLDDTFALHPSTAEEFLFMRTPVA